MPPICSTACVIKVIFEWILFRHVGFHCISLSISLDKPLFISFHGLSSVESITPVTCYLFKPCSASSDNALIQFSPSSGITPLPCLLIDHWGDSEALVIISGSQLIASLVCVCLYGCLQCSQGIGGQKRVSDSSELKLQVVLSYPTWVLGTKFGPSEEQQALLTVSHLSNGLIFVFNEPSPHPMPQRASGSSLLCQNLFTHWP